MHIKAIKIAGFRSYREQTVVENLSKSFNIIVGQNGSGKSNFFAAIQFVLSNDFTNLDAAKRLGLMHDGDGTRVTSASVELIFDNTDRRVPAVDADEFTISRQITAKKDSYYIDGRSASRADIGSLMESAGFSRSNPYYIIKQGKIVELANASDVERLKLLREVAGTRVYDEKKKDSLKLLEEASGKLEKVQHVLSFLDEKLKGLQLQKDVLEEYQQDDRNLKAVQYALLVRELADCKKDFDKFTKEKAEIQSGYATTENVRADYSKKMAALESDIRMLEVRHKGLDADLKKIQEEQAQMEAEQTFSNLKSRDLQEVVEQEEMGREACMKMLQELERNIAAKQKELEEIRPQFAQAAQQQDDIFEELADLKRQRAELYAASGGEHRFTNAEERDREFKQRIIVLNQNIEDTKEQLAKIQQVIDDESSTATANEQRIQVIESEIDNNKVKMEQLTRDDDDLRKQRDVISRELYTKQSEYKVVTDNLTELDVQYHHHKTSFLKMLPWPVAEGIRNIEEIIADLELTNTDGRFTEFIRGYHGLVINLMEADSTYFKALEVTGGSTLTHHVVDSERVAMFLLKQINQRGMRGQATFFALNRVHAPEPRPLRDNNGRHLVSVIRHSNTFTSLFRRLFGNTILVRDIATGRKIAANENFNCVTFDGDEINMGGPLSGGYLDARKSKLEAFKCCRNLEPSMNEACEAANNLTKECNVLEKKLNEIRIKLAANEQERSALEISHDNITGERRDLFELNNKIQMNMEARNQQLNTITRTLQTLVAHRDQLNSKIGTPFVATSESQEAREIAALDARIKDQTARAETILNQVTELKDRKNRLENELSASLLRQREDLRLKVNRMNFEVKQHELNTRTGDLQKLKQRVNEIQKRKAEVSANLEKVREEIDEKRFELRQLNDKKTEVDTRAANRSSEINLIRRRMAECNQKREENTKKIKELGTVAAENAEAFNDLRRKDLEAQWIESLNRMKKYTKVNKKALDQYTQSSAERDNFYKQLTLQRENHDQIKELIDHLDTRKNDALYLTFKQVANNFRKIFQKLAPGGGADLIMKTATVDQNDAEAVARAQQTHVLDRFTGISIRVNFQNKKPEGTKDLHHLSGGQRTLVAMSLIFAIQKCDPAPFYLFDEIDAALDQEKRQAVAKMINELSSTAQFIATTFRPEMLEYAKKVYGVRFRNKISYISPVTSIEARDFLSFDDAQPANGEEEEGEAMEVQ